MRDKKPPDLQSVFNPTGNDFNHFKFKKLFLAHLCVFDT